MFASKIKYMLIHSLQGATVHGVLIACLLCCGAQHAHAQQEVRYPQLLEHGGKRIAAYVNEINDTPTWIIDTDSLDFTLGSSVSLSTESGVETAADAFVEDTKALFGVDPKNLDGPTIIRSGEVWLISYQQVFSELNVLGAKLGFTVTRQGRLLAAGARLFPKVNVNTTPSLSAEAAMQAATGHASIPDADVSAKDELVILAVEVDDAYVYGLAWEITVSNHNLKPPRSKIFLVDAHSGKILQEYDNVSHGGHLALAEPDRANKSGGGTNPAAKDERAAAQSTCEAISGSTHGIEGHISLNYYQHPVVSMFALYRATGAFPYARFSVSGGSPSNSCEGYADADGKYSAGLDNAGTYTVTFYVESDTVSIGQWSIGTGEPSLACQQQVSFTMAVDGHEKLDYGWGSGVSGDGGTSSFMLNSIYNTIEMQNYFRGIIDDDHMPDQAVTLSVSPGRTSSAEPIGVLIGMGGVAAMSNEIVMHEYAHLVVNPLVPPGGSRQMAVNERKAVQEAAADYFAADKTRDALWAGPVPDRGVDLALAAADGDLNSYTRNLANMCKADDFSECGIRNEYEMSLVLSGALWSLRGSLSRATELFYSALAMEPGPSDFIAVYDNMYAAAGEGEKGVIHREFFNRLVIGPPPATELVATCSSTAGNIVLTWTDEASNEAGYEVERQTDDGALQLVVRLGPNVETYSDTGASCGGSSQTTYSYHVTVFSTSGSTNTDTLRTVSVPATYPAGQSQGKFRASSLVVPEALQTDESVTFATELRGVYPNPFNPVTTVSYALKEEDQVSLVVYNVLGQRVAVLVDGVQAAGEHTITLDGNRLPSGPYFLRMETSAYRQTRMMMLAK